MATVNTTLAGGQGEAAGTGMVIGSWVNAETASAYCLKSAAGYHTPKKQR